MATVARAGAGRLPDFLIIGAMKAGTTSLYRLLSDRADVFMPDLKEPDFFVAEKTWGRGLDWYRGLFASAPRDAVVGEASTSYAKCTEFGGVPERIRAVAPDVRLVYVLRHPVERMRSMYLHQVRYGRERAPIDVALLTNPIYLDASRYGLQLRRFLDHFDRSRVHVVLTEALRDDPQATLEGVTDHLGLPGGHRYPVDGPHANETSVRGVENALTRAISGAAWTGALVQRVPPGLRRRARRLVTRPLDADRGRLGPETVATLVERLRPDLDELRDHLGDDFDAWGLLR